jgi:hypothetical protein
LHTEAKSQFTDPAKESIKAMNFFSYIPLYQACQEYRRWREPNKITAFVKIGQHVDRSNRHAERARQESANQSKFNALNKLPDHPNRRSAATICLATGGD